MAMRLALLVFHIVAGTLSLLAGTVAMVARKGGRAHRVAGNVFVAAMLTLTVSGFGLAVLKSQMSNMIAAVVTFYLIGSAWLAGRGRERPGGLEWAGLGLCFVAAVGIFTLGWRIGEGAVVAGKGLLFVCCFFGGLLLLAGAGDLRMLVRGGVSGRPRIVRHLWRMCVGLFIATGSFFLGQPQVFPVGIRGSIYVIVPAVLPLVLLAYWMVRVRYGNAYRLERKQGVY